MIQSRQSILIDLTGCEAPSRHAHVHQLLYYKLEQGYYVVRRGRRGALQLRVCPLTRPFPQFALVFVRHMVFSPCAMVPLGRGIDWYGDPPARQLGCRRHIEVRAMP